MKKILLNTDLIKMQQRFFGLEGAYEIIKVDTPTEFKNKFILNSLYLIALRDRIEKKDFTIAFKVNIKDNKVNYAKISYIKNNNKFYSNERYHNKYILLLNEIVDSLASTYKYLN